jgi:hypothetical protein
MMTSLPEGEDALRGRQHLIFSKEARDSMEDNRGRKNYNFYDAWLSQFLFGLS